MESDCEICPNGYEYRFNPTEALWFDHLSEAEASGCSMAMIRSSEDQAAAVKAMEPYIGWMYKAEE